jgi:hypothetical protein
LPTFLFFRGFNLEGPSLKDCGGDFAAGIPQNMRPNVARDILIPNAASSR